MKRIVIAAFAAVIGLGMMIPEAEARRLGGGKSIGMSRSTTTAKPAAPPPKQATAQQAAPAAGAAAAPAAASGMSRWMGPIAGLAAGLGLAALFSHLGMGEGFANFVMIALLAMAAIFVLRLIFRKKQPATAPMQYAGAGAPANFDAARFDAAKVGAGGTAAAHAAAASPAIPADFDVEGFVRQAKLNFVRLQAANDRGDMDDIREFTAPEMFAEIQMQYQERGKSAQQTDVMELNADLLEVVTEDNRHVASVRFFGQLREGSSAAAEAFDEIWHLTKPVDGSRGWRIDGIQQA